MSREIKPNGYLKIEAYNLAEMLQEVQQAVLEGYRLDLDSNDTYPFGSGGYYAVTLVPEGVKEVVEDTEGQKTATDTPEKVEATVEAVKTPSKPGRPKAK